jgi:hypothetical protein
MITPLMSSRFRRSSNVLPSESSLYRSTSDRSSESVLADLNDREYSAFKVTSEEAAWIAGRCSSLAKMPLPMSAMPIVIVLRFLCGMGFSLELARSLR